MSDKLYPYTYEIKTKKGETITNRMNKGRELLTTKESMGRKILHARYPGCQIIHLKPKAPKIIRTNMVNHFVL